MGKTDYNAKVVDLLYGANLLWFTLCEKISADTVYNVETADEALADLYAIKESLNETKEIPEEELEKIRKYIDDGISIVKVDKLKFEAHKN